MTIKKSRGVWRGDSFADLETYVREFRAGGYPVGQVKEVVCRQCGGASFAVGVDDEDGCAVAACLACRVEAPVADSADHLDDADIGECACPCGGETFAVVVGFAMTDDDEVRWISVGLRCLTDGTLGVYADWKIDYEPSGHLLAGV